VNALMQIVAYRKNDGWAFDDEAVGLVAEPFVSGIPEMIDVLADQVGTGSRILLTFSPTPFPGSMIRLDWMSEDLGGNWYRWEARKMDGWLCPALLKYFATAPEAIHIEAKKVTE
jgi:hypothetical protein